MKDILTKEKAITINYNTPISDVAKIMKEKGVDSVLIMKEDKIIGIFTEKDLVRAIADNASLNTPVSNYMSSKLITAKIDEPIVAIAYKMVESNIRHIPITNDQGTLLGVANIKDVLSLVLASGAWP
ncbi:putative signal-transduction protein containing cAMP-binding and CBS domains [Caldisphaera lagunensis DSM 15908]|uniref:Putative signal-transduction protein containing cAMP-binding and CBS domains n=1 Tax=Caldisphaera lagunensis (strain DSM 15908 / JCM 11604 / ANMR 0165 / IC-154) TaxID=1056495 RepID=L0AAR8_CALLD|nr:putative signal-transduction protein containing cAMP-binding and CBS domains [Caldisphaera lagunensis DSM 15908]